MSDRNYEDEILDGAENEEPAKEKTGSEKILRIFIAAIIVAVVVVAVLASVLISILGGKDNKEETTTASAEETTTLTEEITTSPLEAYTPGKYTVNIGENGKLNIRKEPNKDAEQLGSVPSGTLLEITEIKYDETADEDSKYWGRTVYLGWDAWVSMKYLANAYSDTVVTPGESRLLLLPSRLLQLPSRLLLLPSRLLQLLQAVLLQQVHIPLMQSPTSI